MVAEGFVALIWAAAAIAFTGGYGELASYMQEEGASAGKLVREISMDWLGTVGGILAILGVVAAPHNHRGYGTAQHAPDCSRFPEYKPA